MSLTVTAALSEYEIRHLVEHLHAAANGAAVHRLLRMEDAQDGANAWFAAQDELRNVDGYLRDLRFALELTGPHALGLDARYALMLSSTRSVASAVPAALLARAVEEGVRTIDEALAQIEQIMDPTLAAETLLAVTPHAPAGRHADLRLLAARIDDEDARAQAVVGLAGTLGEAELPELLADIERLAPGLDDGTLAYAVATLAPRIGGRYAPRLMALAGRMSTGARRADALVAVAPLAQQRDRQALMDEALDCVLSGDAPIEQDVLATLLATMPAARSERIREALVRDALADLEDAGGVVRLARRSLRGDEQMLAARRAIELDPWDGALDELLALAPEVPDAELGELLALARGIDPGKRDDRTMARLVCAVAPRLSPGAREGAVATVDGLGESVHRCAALAALGERSRAAAEAARLADPAERASALFELREVDAAVRAADEIGDPAKRAELLLSAGEPARVPQTLVRETLTLIAERAAENVDPTPAGQLARLGPYLPASLVREAIDIALAIDERQPPHGVRALSGLAPHLQAADLRVLVEQCGHLVPVKRARVLRDLADCAPAELHPTILDQAAELDAEDIRSVVSAYVHRIAPSLLEDALQVCRPIGNADTALTTATAVAVAARISPVPEFVLDGAIGGGDIDPIVNLMSEEQLATALRAADAMASGAYERTRLLGGLARVVPAEELAELVRRAGRDDSALVAVIHGGAERLPEALVDRLAGRAAGFRRPVERFTALARLAPRLRLETRDRLRSGTADLNVLLALANGAPPAVRRELLDAAAEAADTLESEAAYVDARRRLAHYVDDDERADALRNAYAYALSVEDAEARHQLVEDALGDLAQVDPAHVLDQLGALDRDGQRRMLPWLLALLDESRRGEVVQRAEALEPEDARADALARLAGVEGLTPATVALLHQAGRRLTDPDARAKALAALLPIGPASIAAELRALIDTGELAASGRAFALSALMARGSDDARVTDFSGSLAARRSPMARERPDLAVVFAGAADRAVLWARLMRVLGDHPRSTIFGALSAFAAVAAEHGEELSAELVEAVSDCMRWWP